MKSLLTSIIVVLFFNVSALLAADNISKDYNRAYKYFAAKKYNKALKHMLPIAEAGNPRAQYLVCIMYHRGKGTEKNLPEAARWCQLSANNNIDGALKLAGFYLDGVGVQQDYERAINLYHKLAERRVSKAQLFLGELYDFGKYGTKPSKVKALFWYRASYTEKAKKRLRKISKAERYTQDGIKAEKSKRYKKAKKLFQKAAALNHPVAQYKIGKVHYVKDEDAVAFDWFIKAMRQGYGAPMKYLGHMYDNGLGVKQDKNAAINYYRASLSHNYGDGFSIYPNDTSSTDARRRIEWLQKKGYGTKFSITLKEEGFSWKIIPYLNNEIILYQGKTDITDKCTYLSPINSGLVAICPDLGVNLFIDNRNLSMVSGFVYHPVEQLSKSIWFENNQQKIITVVNNKIVESEIKMSPNNSFDRYFDGLNKNIYMLSTFELDRYKINSLYSLSRDKLLYPKVPKTGFAWLSLENNLWYFSYNGKYLVKEIEYGFHGGDIVVYHQKLDRTFIIKDRKNKNSFSWKKIEGFTGTHQLVWSKTTQNNFLYDYKATKKIIETKWSSYNSDDLWVFENALPAYVM